MHLESLEGNLRASARIAMYAFIVQLLFTVNVGGT